MSILATKEIGQMLVHLESDNGRGSIAVSNAANPGNIVQATGFHMSFDEALDLFYNLETTKDVHGLFSGSEF